MERDVQVVAVVVDLGMVDVDDAVLDRHRVERQRGLERGEFEIHFPKRFTRMMKLMRHLPYTLYFPAIRKMTGL